MINVLQTLSTMTFVVVVATMPVAALGFLAAAG